MKKEFKKSILAITVSGLLALTLSACGEPSGVSTGESKPVASQNETPEQKQTAAKEDIKKSAINKDFTVNGLKVKIGEIQVHLGDVFNDKTFEVESFDQTIELK